ncbi:hypothetical protein B0T18DRAFT_391420 [Schizothecium vesticola]|uniref:Uncharacterized protein n=1 Tax=Schizothecium vesticola TaxID=314040 RepID=A0AA40K6E2_9PEZI|nr:hypothetical protein B0T18DRAFT_391420 [Schizothecium vesticola]
MHHQTLVSVFSVLCTMAAAAPATERPASTTLDKRLPTTWPSFCGPFPSASTTDITCVLPDTTASDLDAILARLDPKYCQKTDDGIVCTKDVGVSKRDTADSESGPWVLVPLEKRDTPAVVLPVKTVGTITPALKDITVPVPKDFVLDGLKGTVVVPGGGFTNPGSPVAGWEVGGDIGPYHFYIKGGKSLADLVINPAVLNPVFDAPVVRVGGL